MASGLIRAMRLDGDLYAEARADTTATTRALALVMLVALAHGASGIIRSIAFERDPILESFLVGVQGEIVFWVVAGAVIYLVGRYVFGGRGTYGQVVRPLGFAVAPGLLIVVAALASLVGSGPQVLALVVLVAWRFAASFVAVRQALRLNRVRSAITLLAGTVCGLAMVGGSIATMLTVFD